MEDVSTFYGHFMAYFVYLEALCYIYYMAIWYIFPRFGILHQEKSGNPGLLQIGNPKRSSAGLPDFSWSKHPKREKIYQKATNCSK
jgi:hypothetical protein